MLTQDIFSHFKSTLLTSPFFCLFREGINTQKVFRLSELVFDNFLHRV